MTTKILIAVIALFIIKGIIIKEPKGIDKVYCEVGERVIIKEIVKRQK